jgi:hypothetical protein
MCPCGGCKQTSELNLTFVAHVGEVATQTIKCRKKLVRVDVMYVHRLLKNRVTVPEHLLVSGELFGSGGAASSELRMQETEMDLAGIGRERVYFADVEDMALLLGPVPDPSWP